jgi:hypothetical protein
MKRSGEWALLTFAVVFSVGLVLLDTKEFRSFQPDKKFAEAGAKTVTSTNTETDNYALDNQNYTWYGNQWMPPPHVPLYTREDMFQFFSTQDTLFIGDSTGRRAYATIFALMNASDPANIQVDELDHTRVVDINKKERRDEPCTNRNFTNTTTRGMLWFENRQGTQSVCRQVPSDDGASTRKFDFIRADCWKDVYNFANVEANQAFHEYSLVVVTNGFHEAVNPACCDMMRTKRAPERLQLTLEALQRLSISSSCSSHKKMTIVWRTHGFHSQRKGGVRTLTGWNQRAKDWIAENGTNNMLVVDWGQVVYPRSFESIRIEGDMEPHYGLGARLLFAQMLIQQLMAHRGIIGIVENE